MSACVANCNTPQHRPPRLDPLDQRGPKRTARLAYNDEPAPLFSGHLLPGRSRGSDPAVRKQVLTLVARLALPCCIHLTLCSQTLCTLGPVIMRFLLSGIVHWYFSSLFIYCAGLVCLAHWRVNEHHKIRTAGMKSKLHAMDGRDVATGESLQKRKRGLRHAGIVV